MTELTNSNSLEQSMLVISNEHFQTISIYLLCTANEDEEFSIQAVFSKNFKCDFRPIDRIHLEEKSEIILYRLDHDVTLVENGQVNDKYHLKMLFTTRSLPMNCEDSKVRLINPNQRSQFLFDVQFHRQMPLISKRRTDDFWTQLCFYTVFLIKNNLTDQINDMIEQFQHELRLDPSRKLTEHSLIGFFYTYFHNFPQINSHISRHPHNLKILLQVVGHLPIEKNNFKADSDILGQLSTEIYGHLRDHLPELLQSSTEQDWHSISRGLTIFMSAQLLNNKTIFNTFALLKQMKDDPNKQGITANCLINRLIEFHAPIRNDSYTELFPLITDKHLLINYLQLINTFDEYLIVLQCIVKDNSNINLMEKQLAEQFDRFVNRTEFTLSFNQIILLFTSLQSHPQSLILSNRENLQTYQSIIKSSGALRSKISSSLDKFDTTKIPLESFDQLFQLDHSLAILKINKTNYLIRIMTNYPHRTSSFFIKYFRYFLCEKTFRNTPDEQKNYQSLLKNWLDYVANDLNILTELDSLLDYLQNIIHDHENDPRMGIVLRGLLNICFEPNHLYEILVQICTKVNNKRFLDLYTNYFTVNILETNRKNLKSMDNPTNPLYQLLQISKMETSINQILLGNLIAECAKLIELNNEEIRYESFVHPTKKTVTFTILFDKHFTHYGLVEQTINQLHTLWNRWEHIGLTLADLQIWKDHDEERRTAFNLIWDKVRRRFQKQRSIDALFNDADSDYKRKKEVNQAMMMILNLYCDRASDYSRMMNFVRDMLQNLNENSIKSVEIPVDLQIMKDIVHQINPLSQSKVWLNYYSRKLHRLEGKGSQFNASSKSLHSESDDERQASGRSTKSLVSDTPVDYSHRARNNSEIISKSSVEILSSVQRIYQEFQREISLICENWKNEAIHRWIRFFPNDQNTETECSILSEHLKIQIPKELIDILTLWNKDNRTFIAHVCQGCLNLAERLSITIKDDDLNVLQTLVTIDENILGEKCSYVYQNYLQNYVQPYSRNTLVVWSQYSIANELIDFIVGMASTDLDNLLENVNDWGMKLVGAKTVRDYQILKHYFDQVYSSIDRLREDSQRLTLPNVFQCYDQIDMSDQIGNMEEIFNICSIELPNMRQSHEELIDKELSKRRLIINIMSNSSVKFLQLEQFNVQLSIQNLNFADLSELRDRARLIEYSYRNKMRDDDEYQIEQMDAFIQFVNTIEIILRTLADLHIAGYPIQTDILQLNDEFLCQENEYRRLIEFRREIEEICHKWEKTLCEKYILYPELTYFSCQQFEMLEEYIYHRKSHEDEQYGYHLLKYIGLDPLKTHRTDQRKSSAEDRLETLGTILSEQRSTSEQRNPSKTEILLIEIDNKKTLHGILSLCAHVQCNPRVNQLFYCSNETTWMDIRGFVYRCFYSGEFHQLIRPECLSSAIQDQMIDLIRKFIEINPQKLFSFAILTNKSQDNQQFIESLKSLQILHIVPDQNLLSEDNFRRTLLDFIQRCTLVTSRLIGLGKSHAIIEECRKLRKYHLKIPISGNIRGDHFAKRLLKKVREFPSGAIHFDMGMIENGDEMSDLINCLILFRSFCFGQIAISIPSTMPIFIELDSSTYSNLWTQIGLFEYLPLIHLDQIDWRRLTPTKCIRFVGNYLKSIKDQTITTTDLTETQMKGLPSNEYVCLIREFFFQNQSDEFITWNKVFIYISIFYHLFLGFSRCSYFQWEYLQSSRLGSLRMEILQAFLKSADQFTSSSIEAVRQRKRCSTNRTDQCNQELNNAIIRWDQLQPFTLIFSPSDFPIFVYKTEKDVPISLKTYFDLYHQKSDKRSFLQRQFTTLKPDKPFFPDYRQLTHAEFFEKLMELLEIKYQNRAICIRCFRKYENDVGYCEMCKEKLDKPVDIADEGHRIAFRRRIARIIESEYVLTADNFIKMLLIFLRVQSGVPVLIMGETGCGKTALITCLCRKILDDHLHVFRLHAGVTNEKLLEEMEKLIVQAEQLPDDKRFWVFFDEFNTVFNISLLKEIICERTLLGKPLPKTMVLLGTCNPRRQKPDGPVFNENVGLKKDRYEILKLRQEQPNLLYTVTQIPETMLEYIWDYGHLDQATEKTYITATLKTCEGFAAHPNVLTVVADLISASHQFLRELEDISSVSLRDVARFCRLYKWFRQSLDDPAVSSKQLVKDASLLTLLLCYYFRLDTKGRKEKYLEKLDLYLCSVYNQSISTYRKYIEDLLEHEQDRLMKQLRIPDDMAHNRALKDNLFVLFSCIINHIPVFLCGKPGASKTSAVQILMNNLKGLRSDQSTFRKLPELVAVAFQGSQSCTSKDIEQVFKRAKKFMEIQTNSPLLPVIIFDEIGLAESSLHNPLKVLHEHLEIEECQFGFVGISNWRLDASKMNRALYIACLDPDDKDLEITGVFLSKNHPKSHSEDVIDQNIILGLAQAYFDLQRRMSNISKSENYFGLRDYYSLIKGIVHDCVKNPNQSKYEIIYQQLIVNFGGINNGSDYMWQKFCSLLDRFDLLNRFPTPTPKELIEKCLINRNSRHLMLIVDREGTIDHVERYITTHPVLNGSVKTLVGSQFEGDLLPNGIYTESYSTRVLMEIILYAETPITLVMRRMNHLYDSLYDLFNQNFARLGRRKFCRIALSAIYNPQCFVHDQFFCVILLNADDVKISDPPFLNRFEKHYIAIEKLTQERAWSLTSQLMEWTLNLPIPNVNKPFLSLKSLLLPFCEDYICDLVIDNCQDDQWTDEMILNSCKQRLLRACSLDFVLALSLDNTHRDLIDQYYQIHQNLFNISQLISSTLEQPHPTKRLIYTYTSIYDSINYIHSDQIQELKLNSIKTELELTNHLRNYTQKSTSSSILIIRIDYHREKQHILSVKYNLLNQWLQLQSSHIWLIFHLQRNKLSELTNDVLFHTWDSMMIEDLNNDKQFILKDLLLNPSYEYFLRHYPIDYLHEHFDEYLHRAWTKFRYENLSNDQQTRRYNRLTDLSKSDEYFRDMIIKTIKYLIHIVPNPIRLKDWREDLISNQYISVTCRSFHTALQALMSSFYDCYFKLLIHHFENFDLINSYMYLQDHPSDLLKNSWETIYHFSLKNVDASLINVDVMEIHLIDHLILANATKEYDNLKRIREIVHEKDEDDLEALLIKLLKENTTYGGDLIDVKEFFDLYYHDQLILFHMENKFQISNQFTRKLLTTNTRYSTIQRLIQLIVYPDVLIEILRFFEDGFQLFTEDRFVRNMEKQLLTIQSFDQLPLPFYSLILRKENYHLIPPNALGADEEYQFHPEVDPYIEISLLNLIECIISPELIEQCRDLEQITSIYSSINQRVLKLQPYEVRNRERLSSFMSLLRCIKTLNPTKALIIFQKSCKDLQFNGNFLTANDIDQFIVNLKRLILSQTGCEFDPIDVQTILLKLEVEFLKNWLVAHSDQHYNVLQLIHQTNNPLWKYSAKIFSHIVGQLDLLNDIEFRHQLQTNNELDDYFNSIEQSNSNIHLLFANRIYLDLTLRFSMNEKSIRDYLVSHFENFQSSIQAVMMSSSVDTQLILILAWVKFYCQLYSNALVNGLVFSCSDQLDQCLTNDSKSFPSTLKLFLLKQILDLSKMNLNQFRKEGYCRDVRWLMEFFGQFPEEINRTERSLIPPMPLLEMKCEYLQVNNILTDYTDDQALEKLISSCSTNQYLCYGFYLWFIKYYSQFANENFQSNDHYRNYFHRRLSVQSKIFLQPIGIEFLQMLSMNFTADSYFHLNSSMSDQAVAIRLVILSIFAFTLSFKASPRLNVINTLLFDHNLQMPNNYYEHLQKLCLFGLIDFDPIKNNMKQVQRSVRQRLSTGKATATGKYIYQCSKDCLYLYDFTHYGNAKEKSQCPFCKKEIGSVKNGKLIPRDPPQIPLSIEEGFRVIEEYIQKCNRENQYGYHRVTRPNESTLDQRADHLRNPITHRFLHLFLHSILILLKEFNYLSNEDLQQWNIESNSYFQDHLEKDYQLFERVIPDPPYTYVWIYQLLNSMLTVVDQPSESLDSPEKLIEFEQLIEQQVINLHCLKKMDDVKKYKQAFAQFNEEEDLNNTLSSFVDERTENDRRYSYLQFFNLTPIFHGDPIEEFYNNLQTVSHANTNYPLTMFVLKRIDHWSHIQKLYPIVQFLNYLREKYNHRISRQQAVSRSLQECLDESGKKFFEKFTSAWSQIDLIDVQYGCQVRRFDREMNKEKNLAFFSLNVSQDDSSLILAAVLETIGKFQNQLIHYFHRDILQSTSSIRQLPIHTIEEKHLFKFDRDFLRNRIIKHAMVINYQYGHSREIIYDYEEIEMTLRSMIQSLLLLDVKKFRKIQYQFELYSENNALINAVRQHIAQQQLDPNFREQSRRKLLEEDENIILQYLSSIDHIFTYMQNRNYRSTIATIKQFVQEYIHIPTFTEQNAFLKSSFASIRLEYIIDLYELIEEVAFDKIFRNHMEEKLNGQTVQPNQRIVVQKKFISMTIDNPKLAIRLRNLSPWIRTLKRFMVRILPDYLDINIPMEIYLKRSDLWNGDITQEDIDTIQLDETILLKHTFIILLGLENRLNETETPPKVLNNTPDTSRRSQSSRQQKVVQGTIFRDS